MTNFRFSYPGAVALVVLAALLSGCVGLRPDPML
jgi:hypothetical protein